MDFKVLDSKYVSVINDDELQLIDKKGDKFVLNSKEIFDMGSKHTSAEGILQDDYKNFTPVAVNITDSLGNKLTETDLLDSVKSGEVIALDVSFEATHTGGNDNHYIYTSDALNNGTSSWMYPYAKPLIKNHDTDTEAIGRVQTAEFKTSALDSERETIETTFRVTDSDAMVKFADGRYKTMSIGGSVQDVACNICGKDILKDGKFKFCGHWRGEVYANQKATWTAKSMTFREGSVVNVPADKLAQVVSMKAIKANGDGKVANSTNDNVNVIDDIDSILDNVDPVIEPTAPTTDTNDNNVDPVVVEPVIEDNKELEEAKAKIAELEAKVADAEEKIASKDEEIKTLNDSIVSKDEEIKTLNDASVDNNVETLKDQVKRLAEFNKQLLRDHAKVLNSSLTDEELEGKTAKELKSIIDAAIAEPVVVKTEPTVVSPVVNPGVAVIDNNTVIDEPVVEKKKATSKKSTLSSWDRF